ncbi:MAG: DegT/DnrJ/EryC1/StrS family aminotransferase, partial [Actinomycetota bacterium]|nr:DegT/DnrJ/EryC1/StrS family aminotransferase [Actinomycetota bacterium]
MKIPVTVPYCGEEEKEVLARVVESGWLTQGSFVTEFEDAVADYVGALHGVATSSCTTAMHVALLLYGVGPGDEVIVPSYTWIATANVVRMTGATPVFADIDPATFNVTPDSVRSKLTPKTKALLPVHQMGMPLDLEGLYRLAADYGLVVVEDAACAIGSRYRGRPVGGTGGLSCFSFHPRKVITTGEGGMLVTDDDALAERARSLTHHGASMIDVDKHAATTITALRSETFPEVGYNYRMTNLQGGIGRVQMKRLEEILSLRKSKAARYSEAFSQMPHVGAPPVPEYADPNWQTYAVWIEPDAPMGRDQIAQELLDAGIACRPGLIACHLQPPYRSLYPNLCLPHT